MTEILENHKNIIQRQTELSWWMNFAHMKIIFSFWKDIEIRLTRVCVRCVSLAQSSSQKFASRRQLSLSCCCWQHGFTQHQSNHCDKLQVMALSWPISFACLFILAWLPCPLPDIASGSHHGLNSQDMRWLPIWIPALMPPFALLDQEYQRLKVGMESLLASNEEKVKTVAHFFVVSENKRSQYYMKCKKAKYWGFFAENRTVE